MVCAVEVAVNWYQTSALLSAVQVVPCVETVACVKLAVLPAAQISVGLTVNVVAPEQSSFTGGGSRFSFKL
ncbi:hypothetical protein NU09_3443 [Flavobacterium beibuense]|uniref:Uncharacterized protein n=1 Tax=Flavobacterium beibuense TaxID=657326 RepID=A0A444W3W0_9FLAO|nr:hypothetical protein NU09_3443 [Flavobacterium beibuense]